MMKLTYNFLEDFGNEYVEVVVTDGIDSVVVEEGSKFFIESSKQFNEVMWLEKGKKQIETDRKINSYNDVANKVEEAERILKNKYPKKDTYISSNRTEIWLYHKNGNVMKIVKVEDVLKTKSA